MSVIAGLAAVALVSAFVAFATWIEMQHLRRVMDWMQAAAARMDEAD